MVIDLEFVVVSCASTGNQVLFARLRRSLQQLAQVSVATFCVGHWAEMCQFAHYYSKYCRASGSGSVAPTGVSSPSSSGRTFAVEEDDYPEGDGDADRGRYHYDADHANDVEASAYKSLPGRGWPSKK